MLLREAGLIQDRRDGWNIFYRVTKPEVFSLIDASAKIVGEAAPKTGDNPHPRKNVANCPCPKCNPGSNCGSPVDVRD
jgi:ArsR family transcriptional regulator